MHTEAKALMSLHGDAVLGTVVTKIWRVKSRGAGECLQAIDSWPEVASLPAAWKKTDRNQTWLVTIDFHSISN